MPGMRTDFEVEPPITNPAIRMLPPVPTSTRAEMLMIHGEAGIVGPKQGSHRRPRLGRRPCPRWHLQPEPYSCSAELKVQCRGPSPCSRRC